eukprot:jgi/Mesvir1/5892/Mv00664-RA.1
MDALRMEKKERDHPLLRPSSLPAPVKHPACGFVKKLNSVSERPDPIARLRHCSSQACDFRGCARDVATPSVPEACDSSAMSGGATWPRPVARILEALDPRSSNRLRCGAACEGATNAGFVAAPVNKHVRISSRGDVLEPCTIFSLPKRGPKVVKFRELAAEEVFSEAEVRLINQSWAVICNQVDSPMEFGMVFYDHLFKLAPEVAHLFSTQGCTQAMSFVLMFKHIVALLQHVPLLVESLEKCAHRHMQYGVLPQHFPIVGEALMRTLVEFLGGDKHLDISVARAWEHLWSIVSKIMLKEIARVELQPCALCMAGATCPCKIDVSAILPKANRAH